ncbi:MAG: imelysin family protein [Minwuia sp.]|nr:imelysin family protein [Minwuia sp.]
MRMISVCLLIACAAAGFGPALADATPAQAALQQRLVETVLVETILPDHAALVQATADQQRAMRAACETPSPDSLTDAQTAFRDLVAAFSRVEMYRFGPGREDNRLARLNFWPDRRGLGLRQVRRILEEEDQSATDPATLRGKSVAVQGLSALEQVLADASDGVIPGFACRYGTAIADVTHETAEALLTGWQDSQAGLLRQPGPENPLYRDQGEAVKALLKAAMEQLIIVEQQKLGRVLRDGPASANPLSAPFRLSGMTLHAVTVNIAASRAVLAHPDMADLGDPDLHNLFRELDFELKQSETAIRMALEHPGGIAERIADPATHDLLQFARIPLRAAIDLHDTRLLPTLGLTKGFNALDGD